jgi:hypothetical protein
MPTLPKSRLGDRQVVQFPYDGSAGRDVSVDSHDVPSVCVHAVSGREPGGGDSSPQAVSGSPGGGIIIPEVILAHSSLSLANDPSPPP